MKLITNISDWIKALFLTVKAVANNQMFVLRKAAMGDVLWVEPILRKLALEKRDVFFISEWNSLYENFPFPNVRFIPNNNKSYKRAAKIMHALGLTKNVVYLNNSYEKQPDKHFLLVYQEAAGLPIEKEYPRLYLNDEERNRYKHLKPYIVIHLETTSPMNHRQIYGINWPDLIEFLKSKYLQTPYFIAQHPEEYQLINHFELSTIRDMIAFIYSADLFIGVDSGPSHIAASLNIPSLIFFGSINPWFRHFKESFNGIIMQQPCEFAHCYHRPQKRKKDYSCLLVGDDGIPKCCAFENEMIKNQVENLLAKQPVSTVDRE